ncbi:MAG: hypothetical protein JNN20_18430 [Betaproteobacteria bacterium]|nr:hypothetical protein [Betaproteobacteria bacterium]
MNALSFLPPIIALLGFGFGVYQYYRSNELTYRKPYWEKQLALYLEATSTAATLASTDDEAAWNDARNNFWRLYLGPLCMVENTAVESAMVEFGIALGDDSLGFESRATLADLSLNLAMACRKSIRTDWKVQMENLQRKPVGGD